MEYDNPHRPANHGSGGVRQSLQDLLLLHPPTPRDNPIILSIDPTIWGADMHVIDMTRCIGIAPAQMMGGSDLERRVVLGLQAAGWKAERIVQEYRPDLKRATRIDVALLGNNGACEVAVEIKGEVFRGIRESETWEQLFRSAPGFAWYCLTDGRAYVLHNAMSGERVELQHAFSPSSLETKNFTSEARHAPSVPSSFSELRELLKGQGWVVLDQTMPLIRLDPENRLRRLLEQELGRPLPIGADLSQSLLVWVCRGGGLEWVGGFGMASMLSSESSRWTREELGKQFSVRVVIEVSGVIPNVHIGMRFCVIHLSSNPGPAYMTTILGRGDVSLELQDRARDARAFLAGEKSTQGFTASVDNEHSWAVGAYDPALNEIEAHLADLGIVKKLSELCTITRGANATMYSRPAGVEIPLVSRLAHLDDSEEQELEKVAFTPELERYVLRPGDLVVKTMKGGAQQCAMVQTGDRLLASDRLLVLRVTDSSVTPEYLLEYLNSTLAKRLIEGRYAGAGALMLNARGLGSVPVPIVDKTLALDLRQIGVLEATLRKTADELNTQRRSLFDAKNQARFNESVQGLLRKGELLSRSAIRASELEFQVANFYPFPIAYGYRLLASITNPTDLYKEQLRIGENILAFLASVAMSLVQPSDRASVELDVSAIWDGGASPGHWREIIGKCSKVLSTYKDHPLASNIVRLNISAEKRGFGAAVKALITAKNDFKHDRGPRTEEDFATATKSTQETLKGCIRALAFFTEFPIRQVVDHDVTRTGEVRLRCLAMVGDHPGLPQEEVTHRTPLPKRDLYIAAAGVGWVSLFPLLVARNCPSCKTRETFFLDKWNRKNNTAMRKSFERGHEEETKEVVPNMASWIEASPSLANG